MKIKNISAKVLLTIFTILVYCVPAALILTFIILSKEDIQDFQKTIALMIPIFFMILVCFLVIVNIFAAIVSLVHLKNISFRTVMLFKLILIPFYIINFVCWLVGCMVFHIAIIVWPMIPFIIAYTYFTILATSLHNIVKLFNLQRNNFITKKQFIIHSILQLIFTLDVIDNIYLAIKQNKLETVPQPAM